MLELYHYTSNGIFYLNAHEFVGSQIATGPVVINTEKHNAVEYAPYNPDWSDLSDLESK
jgi:hypothetical protein